MSVSLVEVVICPILHISVTHQACYHHLAFYPLRHLPSLTYRILIC